MKIQPRMNRSKKVRWLATSRIGASRGKASRCSRPWICRRRLTNCPTIGVHTNRCQSQAMRLPAPWFTKRMVRKARRSNQSSTRKGSVSGVARTSLTSEPGHQLGDDLLHDLARASADGEQARVAECPRHRRLDDVAHAAVELLAVVDHPLHEIAREELGHADLLHRRLAPVEEVAGAVGEPARRLDSGEVLDELVPPHLELGERLPERAALVSIAQRLLHQLLHALHRADGGHQPLSLEVGHHVVEALVLFAEQVSYRDAAVLEEEHRGVA